MSLSAGDTPPVKAFVSRSNWRAQELPEDERSGPQAKALSPLIGAILLRDPVHQRRQGHAASELQKSAEKQLPAE